VKDGSPEIERTTVARSGQLRRSTRRPARCSSERVTPYRAPAADTTDSILALRLNRPDAAVGRGLRQGLIDSPGSYDACRSEFGELTRGGL
jgi:hypothetical protein